MDQKYRVDEWVAGHQAEILGFLQKLVQTPSEVLPPLSSGELACQQIVKAAYREAGAGVDVFTPAEVPGLRGHPAYYPTWDLRPRTFEGRPNVVGVFKGSGGGHSLIISTHVDTVSRQPLPWQISTPFSGEILDGKLYGRGAWDTKWGIAAGLYAARCLHSLGVSLCGDVILESVVDEEFAGSHGCLASRLRGYNADFAINCEPTSLVTAISHRGGRGWRIVVRGDAGMAFGDRRQTNPVYTLARVIEAVRAFDSQRNAQPSPPHFYEDNPVLPAYTMQIGGGGSTFGEVSGIPAECYLVVWIEEFPGTSESEHARQFQELINTALARDPGFDGVYPEYIPLYRFIPGSSADPQHPFFHSLENAFRQSGQEYRLGGAPFACDTYVFNLHSPTPAITLGPRGGNAHGADEFVLVEDVLALVRIFAHTMIEWCG